MKPKKEIKLFDDYFEEVFKEFNKPEFNLNSIPGITGLDACVRMLNDLAREIHKLKQK